MSKNFLSDDDDDFNFEGTSSDVPLAQRLAHKSGSFSVSTNANRSGKKSSSVWSDDDEVSPAAKSSRRDPLIELTPPPECSPFVRTSRTNSRLLSVAQDDLPDTEELIPESLSLKSTSSSALSKSSSASSSVSRAKSKEEKENEKRRRDVEKMLKKQQKESEKLMSKEVREAEKIVNKQTDKTEVNKYLVVHIDPGAVNSPPGNEILNMLQNPPTGDDNTDL